MGQYWIPVNLDKKEFVHPHDLGSGLKLWEHLANDPGVGAALIVLTAAMPEARGGGDFDLDENWHGPERKFPEHNVSPGPMPEDYGSVAARTIGRWAGDRIAIVGDYAKDSDLAPEHRASTICSRCAKQEYLDKYPEDYTKLIKEFGSDGMYTDITADVARVIEHELNGSYTGSGWKTWTPDKEKS